MFVELNIPNSPSSSISPLLLSVAYYPSHPLRYASFALGSSPAYDQYEDSREIFSSLFSQTNEIAEKAGQSAAARMPFRSPLAD